MPRFTPENATPIQGLPRIIEYLNMTDAGPCDDGPTDICPHCGSDGRYVHYFKCDDGTTRGAMSGCVKLFPVSQVVAEDMKLQDKARELKGKGWKLNSWQTKIGEAIQAFYRGEVDEAETMKVITRQKNAMAQYRANKARAAGRKAW
jgi:hypothetical protein